MENTFYITTPIYYPSDKLHIGHSYTTVAADAMARYKKLRGYDVKFLTGTDEHGQKIERKAAEAGVTPQEYVDGIVEWIKDLWKVMDIDYDIFMRTTDKKHELAIQRIFKKLYEQGDIYKSEYEGLYCTPCETFFMEKNLIDGKCPDCGRDVETVKEESYFFRLSKYQDRLIDHIEKNPDFIMPQSRQNEMLNNFLKPGLEDLCVSRTSFKWGIPVDFDPNHVVYVWIDALSNYATALGFATGDDTEYKKYWPADVHLVGKEIVRFHSIIWPAILMALNEPLPKQIFGHGWLILEGGKMSKSKGNVVDPAVLIGRYGVDAIRYFLMREISFGQDGVFSNEALLQRINSDLANDLGNLLSRTVGMIDKYFGGVLPFDENYADIKTDFDGDLIALTAKTVESVEKDMDKLFFSDSLVNIWTLIRRANKYADETKPWVLIKEIDDPRKKAELAHVLYNLAEVLRIVSVLISPFMTQCPSEMRRQLNISGEDLTSWDSVKTFGLLGREVRITKGNVIFPRLDIKKELVELNGGDPVEYPESKNSVKDGDKNPEKKNKDANTGATKQGDADIPGVAYIGIDDFTKVQLRVGKILECERVDGSDKLLRSQVRIGDSTRQILSGIAKYYSPEDMVGKNVIVVANLKPVKLRGHMSEGMLLAASDTEGRLKIVTVDGEISDGAVVS